MTCSSCGVKNVEFATTCYSCRHPIGRSRRAAAAPAAREATPVPRDVTAAPRGAAKRARPASFPGASVVRLLFLLALLWVMGRGGSSIREALLALFPSASPQRQSVRTIEREAAPPSAPEAPQAAPIEEQNGFRLAYFQWSVPRGGPHSRFHAGDTVGGRSEVQGFGVTADGRIDLIVALAFRDPTGALVEPVSPTVLRQPVESPTLYSSFDYAIPPDGPPGDYDLEIAVDDAVSGRSVRFHRAIAVAAATAADPPVEATAE